MRMFWNYLRHGFPFVDEDPAVIDDFSLWNQYDEGSLIQKTGAEGFDRDHFIHWLRTNRFIQKKDDGYVLTASYITSPTQ